MGDRGTCLDEDMGNKLNENRGEDGKCKLAYALILWDEGENVIEGIRCEK